MFRPYLFGLFVVLLLSQCIPIPIRKNYLKQPELRICIHDNSGTSIEETRIIYNRFKYPYRDLDNSDTSFVNIDGCYQYLKVIEKERVMPLLMHGVHQYAFEFKVVTLTDSIQINYNPISNNVYADDSEDFNYNVIPYKDSLKVEKVSRNELKIMLKP